MTEFQRALDIVCRVLIEDEEYRKTWPSNIAMAFKDEYMRAQGKEYCSDMLHEAANAAAKHFIGNLTSNTRIKMELEKIGADQPIKSELK